MNTISSDTNFLPQSNIIAIVFTTTNVNIMLKT